MAEFASNGKGNLGVTLGAIGTGLGILNGAGGLLMNGMGYGYGMQYNTNPGDRAVTRYDLDMMRNYERQIADKEHELSLANMERVSNEHDIAVYKQVRSEIKAVEDKLEHEVRRIDAVNAQQGIYNATNTTMIGCLKNQVEQLQGLTKIVIPNYNVCPGWGPVSVTPTNGGGGTTTA